VEWRADCQIDAFMPEAGQAGRTILVRRRRDGIGSAKMLEPIVEDGGSSLPCLACSGLRRAGSSAQEQEEQGGASRG
jgi:hypothetical protein